jgi:hypothetical protein
MMDLAEANCVKNAQRSIITKEYSMRTPLAAMFATT